MTKPILIAVVGNCQARPLASIFAASLPNAQITATAIVHLLADKDEPDYAAFFEAADVIFSQRVTDNYPCSFLRTSRLKETYGNKVICFPNLYYSGYNPELSYLRNEARKPIGGPLGDYHSRTIFKAWQQGLTVKEAVLRHYDIVYNQENYAGLPEKSIQELYQREAETDVRIIDWIEAQLWRQRLFFTFNHPTQALLKQLALSLIRLSDIGHSDWNEDAAPKNEALGRFSCPINPWIANQYKPSFTTQDVYTGNEVVNIDDGKVIAGKLREYQPLEITEAFFKVYDACGEGAIL